MTDSTAASARPARSAANPPKMATAGRLARAYTVDDLRRMARRRLPRTIFDYVDGGGETEFTLRDNTAAFDRIRYRPRTVADIAGRRQSVTIFGREALAPFGICPMGGLGLLWPDADVAIARVAAAAGIPYVLATGANASMERIAEKVPDGRRWFQLYPFREDAVNRRLLQRAASAGFEALVVTTDTQLHAKRTRDLRNGFGVSTRPTLRQVPDFVRRPGWLWSVACRRESAFMGNFAKEVGASPTPANTLAFFRSERSYSVDWGDVKRLRDAWKGPMLLKGIVTSEETERAVTAGIDGIVVSNHGGRNLDGTVNTIDALPEVVAAAAGRLTILLDSGIRRGSDAVKALALGATGTLIGRPIAYAVAAAGEAGVAHVVAMFKDEIDKIQGLLGLAALDRIDAGFVRRDGR